MTKTEYGYNVYVILSNNNAKPQSLSNLLLKLCFFDFDWAKGKASWQNVFPCWSFLATLVWKFSQGEMIKRRGPSAMSKNGREPPCHRAAPCFPDGKKGSTSLAASSPSPQALPIRSRQEAMCRVPGPGQAPHRLPEPQSPGNPYPRRKTADPPTPGCNWTGFPGTPTGAGIDLNSENPGSTRCPEATGDKIRTTPGYRTCWREVENRDRRTAPPCSLDCRPRTLQRSWRTQNPHIRTTGMRWPGKKNSRDRNRRTTCCRGRSRLRIPARSRLPRRAWRTGGELPCR